MARQVAIYPEATPEQMTALALAANAALTGETLNVGNFTAKAGTTVITSPLCMPGRVARLTPLNADASAMSWYLAAMTQGSMTFSIAGPGEGVWAWEISGVLKNTGAIAQNVDNPVPAMTQLQALCPVGHIYVSTLDTNPAELLGFGTWAKTGVGRVLQGADDTHKAGETVEAGLPDITGTATFVNSDGVNQGLYPDIGCFYWGNYNHNWKTSAINEGPAKRDLKFDASRSNSIYGKSSTVQPPALIVNIWVRTA
jgi:hypothetical protein